MSVDLDMPVDQRSADRTSAEVLVAAHGVGRSFSVGGWIGARRTIAAVGHVDLAIRRGETLAIVGESGCGKSTLGRLLLGLERPTRGQVLFAGQDLAGLSEGRLRHLRAHMQLVFQNTLAALDPRMTIGEQVLEPFRIHRNETGTVAPPIEQLLADVGLGAALAARFPHQLSGGQRQRVVMARALATEPDFVVFDEPVSALDVSVQAQIIALIRSLQRQRGFASVFISHDLRVVRHIADRIAVMYLGRVVEEGPIATVFAAPAHPYTRALVSAVPRIAVGTARQRVRLAGEPPSPAAIPAGCPFHPRCALAQDVCRVELPRITAVGAGHHVACHFAAVAAEDAAPSTMTATTTVPSAPPRRQAHA
ncbi:peptide/nickel transport system ATP-binding protein [Chelatococcus asaccharovorans]|uniref:Peptide/nickel transport system ATP-binding protein n=2 Tax=Chelatococcus asaccharovorans TaxID=28210 RepID=A0A2V3TYP2_9HYPH|nr:oligopeptide/dipeptide ABC transporter ATP-binding protein [Chelatococcus asaccharovorans]PXW54564.1 peptide/nickel transport system ATP-binding protein [Chelatococcus asaccharovorans]